MNKLIDLAIQQVLFFANVSEKDVHPDVAVSQLELLVAEMAELPPEELDALRRRVHERLLNALGGGEGAPGRPAGDARVER